MNINEDKQMCNISSLINSEKKSFYSQKQYFNHKGIQRAHGKNT